MVVIILIAFFSGIFASNDVPEEWKAFCFITVFWICGIGCFRFLSWLNKETPITIYFNSDENESSKDNIDNEY